MSSSFSFRRFATTVALAVLGLAWPALAAQAGDFEASGTFVNVSTKANTFEIVHSGRAAPGGPFTGTVSGKRLAAGTVQLGTGTIDFGGGNALAFAWYLELDAESRLLVGTYEFIGGTGRLAGASGSGSLIVDAAAGEFEMSGTLSY